MEMNLTMKKTDNYDPKTDEKILLKDNSTPLKPKASYKSFSKIKYYKYNFNKYKKVQINNCFSICSIIQLKNKEKNIAIASSQVTFDDHSTEASPPFIIVYDNSLSKQLFILFGHKLAIVNLMIVTHNPNLIFSCSFDKTIKVWDVLSRENTATLRGHKGRVLCLEEINEKVIASSSADMTIKLWNSITYENLASIKGNDHWVNKIYSVENGSKLLSACYNGVIKIWDVLPDTLVERSWLKIDENSIITSLIGLKSIYGYMSCGIKNNIYLIDYNTKKTIKIFEGHNANISLLYENQDRKNIISCSLDQIIRVWDLVQMTCVTVINVNKSCILALTTCDNGNIITAGNDKCLYVWH